MGRLKYKGYSGNVEYSAEDNCLYGKVLDMNGIGIPYEGYSVDELQKDFKEAVDFYISSCRERDVEPKKPYSGKLVIRMTSDLHGMVAEAASAAGITINDYINSAIVSKISQAAI